MSTERLPAIALLAAMSLAAGLLFTGCEFNGEYESDNVTVQFENTNGTAQVEAE